LEPEFQVNTETMGYQGGSAVTYSPSGDLLVMWWSNLPPREVPATWIGILGRIYPASGQRLGAEIVARATDKGIGPSGPAVAWQPYSSFLVAWNEAKGITLQSYDAAGHRQGARIVIGPPLLPYEQLFQEKLVALPAGGFVGWVHGGS
jgi:hypothetical protein